MREMRGEFLFGVFFYRRAESRDQNYGTATGAMIFCGWSQAAGALRLIIWTAEIPRVKTSLTVRWGVSEERVLRESDLSRWQLPVGPVRGGNTSGKATMMW